MFKKILLALMEHYVKKYFKRIKPKLVVVAGSVGKTSTKLAIATVLAEKYRVRTEQTNHNMDVSVPPALLGVKYPENVHSIKEWLKVLRAMHYRVYREPKEVDVIVQELGTSKPGDIPYFGRYLKPDIAVITAISEEHMANFPSLDDVAKEELAVTKYSKLSVINDDDVDAKFAEYAESESIDTYGLGVKAEYRLSVQPSDPVLGRMGHITAPEWGELPITVQLVGDHALKAAAAAACVAAKMEMTAEEVAIGISKVRPARGRMNIFQGTSGSTIIDDTYNSSPLAVEKALHTLYSVDSPQKIAILGSMNELGDRSPSAHEEAGKLCDPTQLEWVITIGADAENYLAPAARSRGCQVKTFRNPYLAGGFVNGIVKPGAVVLVKGSQDGVYAEEAVKQLLYSNDDESELVRQSEYWTKLKNEQFSVFASEVEE